MKQQTAVEWLIEQLGEYFPNYIGGIELMVKQAKQMEKEQIVNAHHQWYRSFIDTTDISEEYYNETYGSQGSPDTTSPNTQKTNNMKLYTEEQVRKSIELARTDDVYYPTKDEIVNSLTPITLPSDQEIDNYANKYLIKGKEVFIDGSKWMRDKILNNG